MYLLKFKKWNRKNAGFSILELAVTIPVLIVITVLSINLAALLFGSDFCDRACKDCARVAGQMSTPDEAVNAMNAAATAHPIDGVFLKKMSPELLIYEDYNDSGNQPTPAYGTTQEYLAKNGPEDIKPVRESSHEKRIKINLNDPNQTSSPGPYVTVSNTLYIHIPVIMTFFGAKLFVGNVDSDPNLFKLQSTYTFPITNTYSANDDSSN